MNYKKLIECGKYNEDELTDDQRSFIDGMKFVKDDLIKVFLGWYVDDNTSSIREQIENEVVHEALESFAEWLDDEISGHIVNFADHNIDDEDESDDDADE